MLLENRKFFLLLKFRDSVTGSYVTLHKGVFINIYSVEKYIEYCLNILSIKSNYYTDTVMDQIYFNYFLIEKKKEKHYIDK